jgi:hypothetical protein
MAVVLWLEATELSPEMAARIKCRAASMRCRSLVESSSIASAFMACEAFVHRPGNALVLQDLDAGSSSSADSGRSTMRHTISLAIEGKHSKNLTRDQPLRLPIFQSSILLPGLCVPPQLAAL